jgi:hypothetical protein
MFSGTIFSRGRGLRLKRISRFIRGAGLRAHLEAKVGESPANSFVALDRIARFALLRPMHQAVEAAGSNPAR